VKIRAFLRRGDFGNIIQPDDRVQGQVHGGIPKGIGQAMMEGCAMTANGQLLSASYMGLICECRRARGCAVSYYVDHSCQTPCTGHLITARCERPAARRGRSESPPSLGQRSLAELPLTSGPGKRWRISNMPRDAEPCLGCDCSKDEGCSGRLPRTRGIFQPGRRGDRVLVHRIRMRHHVLHSEMKTADDAGLDLRQAAIAEADSIVPGGQYADPDAKRGWRTQRSW